MILIPMQNAGQRHIIHQLLQRDPYPLRVHADAFGCIADAEHAHTFPCDKTLFPQGLQSIAATVMLGNHAQAGGAAVHGVQLGVVGERSPHFLWLQFFDHSLHFIISRITGKFLLQDAVRIKQQISRNAVKTILL